MCVHFGQNKTQKSCQLESKVEKKIDLARAPGLLGDVVCDHNCFIPAQRHLRYERRLDKLGTMPEHFDGNCHRRRRLLVPIFLAHHAAYKVRQDQEWKSLLQAKVGPDV